MLAKERGDCKKEPTTDRLTGDFMLMRTRWVISSVLLVTVCSFFVTGCFDGQELEEQAFLVTMGVDQVAPGTIALTARVAVPSKLTGSSGGGGGAGGGGDFQSGTPLVTATGKTLHEALSMMNVGVERKINLSHLSAILFSDKVARSGVLPYLRTLVRYREFRRTLYVFVSKGSVSELFLKDKPVLETSATRTIEDQHELSQTYGLAPSVQIHEFINALETPHDDPIAPLWSLNEQVGKEKKKQSGSSKNLRGAIVSFTPGDINRTGGNPIECVGTAVFRGDRMIGELSGDETRYLQLLSGSLQQFILTLPSAKGGKNLVSLGIRNQQPMKVKILFRNGHPKLVITQAFEAELLGDQSAMSFTLDSKHHTIEQVAAKIIQSKEAALITKMYKKMQTNPFHFFDAARNQFATFQQYEAYPWHKQLKNVNLVVNTSVSLRRLGTQIAPLKAR